jgi:hypothetical protein
VDWKLLARADRYFVREAERDSHVAVWLWLDATASMSEPSREINGIDKLWFARTVLACVAAIAQRQGDAFGLLVCTDGKVEFTPASRGPRQLQRVLAALSKAEPRGQLPSAETLRASLHFARAPSMIFAASDFLDWPSPLSEALLRLRNMRHDVRLLTLRTQAEVDASFKSGAGYRDPEQADGLHRMSNADRESYKQQSRAHFDGVAASCRQNNIVHYEARIEQPLSGVLRLAAAGGSAGYKMMLSSYPLWWLALPVLLLPVWWHRQKRQRVKAESLATARFLPSAPPEQLRVWQWRDKLLLVVRCLLLVTLIAWLAASIFPWRGDTVLVDAGADKAWAEKEIAAAGFSAAARIDLPADALQWLRTNERDWRGDAKLLIIARAGQIAMPARVPQFNHQPPSARSPPPRRSQPSRRASRPRPVGRRRRAAHRAGRSSDALGCMALAVQRFRQRRQRRPPLQARRRAGRQHHADRLGHAKRRATSHVAPQTGGSPLAAPWRIAFPSWPTHRR